MTEKVFVGVDVHKNILVATTMGQTGPRLDQSEIPPDPKALVEYLHQFPGELHVTLEACPVWQVYYDAAASTGAQVVLAHPKGVKWMTRSGKKNDRVDSEKLATLLRNGDIPEAYAPTPELRQLRRVASDWVFFHDKACRVMNHTYGLLLQKGVKYPEGILRLKRKREELRALGDPAVDWALDVLKALDPTLKELEKALFEAYDGSKEAQLLTSIPGVGIKTSVALTAYLSPIDRFANLDEIAAYCGLCPKTSQSSKRAWIGDLRTDSNHLLKGLLVMAYWTHRRKSKGSSISRAGKKKEKKRGRQAGAIAGAHKLLDIACAVLRRGTPYTFQVPERQSCSNRPAEP